MQFEPPLRPARLLRRYKRFLADIAFEDGTEATAHCANPGAMTGLAEPGMRIWVQDVAHKGGKLAWSWKLVELGDGHLAGIDTGLPNRIVATALRERTIGPLAGYATILPEQRYGTNSRVDFLLRSEGLPDAYVEVKNAHLKRDGLTAEFPDSVTARGARHLSDLAEMARQGHRAVMLYVVQRTDCTRFALARDIDPAYARAVAAARAAGVEAHVLATRITEGGVALSGALPFAGGVDSSNASV